MPSAPTTILSLWLPPVVTGDLSASTVSRGVSLTQSIAIALASSAVMGYTTLLVCS
jgi:hypothetical protein